LDPFPYVDRAFRHDFDAAPHGVYPHLTTVGEIFHRDPEVTSYFAGGVAHQGIDTWLDTPFDFPVYFALRDVLAHDKPMTELATVLRQDALYPRPTWPDSREESLETEMPTACFKNGCVDPGCRSAGAKAPCFFLHIRPGY
jgi:hypothetical protein